MTRQTLLAIAWPYLREHIRQNITTRLVPVPAVSVSLDEWVVAGRTNRLWAVNVHAVDASWTRFVANLGLVGPLPQSTGVVVDPRPVLDAFGVRDRVFAAIAGHSEDVGLIVDSRLDNVVGECFRGRCLFSAVANAVSRVCTGSSNTENLEMNSTRNLSVEASNSQGIILRGESDVTVESNAACVARCITLICETRDVEFSVQTNFRHMQASSESMVDSRMALTTGESQMGRNGRRLQHVNHQSGTSAQDIVTESHIESNSIPIEPNLKQPTGTPIKPMAENITAKTELEIADETLRLPKPWLKGNFMSMLTEWEMLCAIVENEHRFSEEYVHVVRENLADEHLVMTRAILKILQLTRKIIGGQRRWCLLPDALIRMINLVCAVCDRLTEIEMMIERSVMTGSEYDSMYQYMNNFIRTRTINSEDNEDSSVMMAMVEGCLLNHLLQELYPLVQPFVEYMPNQSYCLMALALDPRFGSLASLISLNKKLMQGCRLVFEKEFHMEESEASSDERVRKLVLNMLHRYDNEMMIPMMVSLNSKIGNGSTYEKREPKDAHDVEEGLFPETVEPTDDWKSRQQLQGELNKFRSYKKNIARTASGTESLRWWETNADLFPNIATLFRKVVSVPSSYIPVERIIYSDGAKMNVTRRRLAQAGLEDVVLIHENLTGKMLSDAVDPLQTGEKDEWEISETDVLMDDDELYNLAPELFSS